MVGFVLQYAFRVPALAKGPPVFAIKVLCNLQAGSDPPRRIMIHGLHSQVGCSIWVPDCTSF